MRLRANPGTEGARCIRSRPGLDPFVEGGHSAAFLYGNPEQIGVRDLLVAQQQGGNVAVSGALKRCRGPRFGLCRFKS